jgi:hypothetical protein
VPTLLPTFGRQINIIAHNVSQNRAGPTLSIPCNVTWHLQGVVQDFRDRLGEQPVSIIDPSGIILPRPSFQWAPLPAMHHYCQGPGSEG